MGNTAKIKISDKTSKEVNISHTVFLLRPRSSLIEDILVRTLTEK